MLQVILQLVDFLLKAGLAYHATPAGKKEWQDIEQAAEGMK